MSDRVGSGLLSGKYGKLIQGNDAVYEAVVISVLSLEHERFGAPNFGTLFLESAEVNEADAIESMNIEAYKGASRENVVVHNISTELTSRPDIGEDIELTTSIIASESGINPIAVVVSA